MSSLRRRVGRRRYGVIPLAVAVVAGVGLAAVRLMPHAAHADQPPSNSLVGNVLQTTGSLQSTLQNTVNGLPSTASQVVAGLTQGTGVTGGQVSVGNAVGITTGTSPNVKPATPSSDGDGSETGDGRAAAMYTPTGLTLLGALDVMPADSGVCDTGNIPASKLGVTAPVGLPGCNVELPLKPLLDLDVLTERVVNGTSTGSKSQVASLALLPKAAAGADVLDATMLTATTEGECGKAEGSASLLTLSIAGQKIVARRDNPQNAVITVAGVATVTFDYDHVNTGTTPPTETASSVRIDFPAGGSLAPLIRGTLFISYAKSQGLECESTPTPIPPTPRPTPPPPPTPTPCVDPDDSSAAAGTVTANDEPGEPGDCDEGTPTPAAVTAGGTAGGNIALNVAGVHASAAGAANGSAGGGPGGTLASVRVAGDGHPEIPLAIGTVLLAAGLAFAAVTVRRRRRRRPDAFRGFDKF